MIKFSEVKPGELFTFWYYDKGFDGNTDFLWVFVKDNKDSIITLHGPSISHIGKKYTYNGHDDKCVILNFAKS